MPAIRTTREEFEELLKLPGAPWQLRYALARLTNDKYAALRASDVRELAITRPGIDRSIYQVERWVKNCQLAKSLNLPSASDRLEQARLLINSNEEKALAFWKELTGKSPHKRSTFRNHVAFLGDMYVLNERVKRQFHRLPAEKRSDLERACGILKQASFLISKSNYQPETLNELFGIWRPHVFLRNDIGDRALPAFLTELAKILNPPRPREGNDAVKSGDGSAPRKAKKSSKRELGFGFCSYYVRRYGCYPSAKQIDRFFTQYWKKGIKDGTAEEWLRTFKARAQNLPVKKTP